MCNEKDCKRHELWGGLCLDHLRAKVAKNLDLTVEEAEEAVSVSIEEDAKIKKIDAVLITTADGITEMETRETE